MSDPPPTGDTAAFDWYATYIDNPAALANTFRGAQAPPPTAFPSFAAARPGLPQPFWEGHAASLEAYWKAWEITFSRLRRPEPANGFVSPYLDTGFNGNLFMWDSAFITLFARYAVSAFDARGTLDNFYAKQHRDGFICREIRTSDGTDCFARFDPAATGPEVLPWAEWEHYQALGDLDRLARVYPALLAYHEWMGHYRAWPDGGFWACGWASGMDNQPRLNPPQKAGGPDGPRAPTPDGARAPTPDGPCEWWDHGHMTWVDAQAQSALAARCLARMAAALGREAEATTLRAEQARLAAWTNANLWDEEAAYYFDRRADGRLTGVKSIGAYWALLAGLVPPERSERFTAHLNDEREFRRAHRAPTLSADHPDFNPLGGYWRGAVWSPTNYMLLRGLVELDADHPAGGFDGAGLAHEIALNHLAAVTAVYSDSGTLWENYAPDVIRPGQPAAPEFVGWTGLTPVAVLLEHVFGLRADQPAARLVWDLRLLEAHGVNNYPFGTGGRLNLSCERRENARDEPRVNVEATCPVTLDLRWAGGERSVTLP